MALERDHLQQQLKELQHDRLAAHSRSQAIDFDTRMSGQLELGRIDREIQTISQRLMQIEDKSREEAEAVNSQFDLDARRAEREEAAFWFRRFFTTLGIANGAAFAALASGLLQADDPATIAPMVGRSMDHFAWGALSAGSIPFWLWGRLILRGWIGDHPTHALQRTWDALASAARLLIFFASTLSVLAFVLGLFTATGAVHGLVEGKKIADAKVAAQKAVRTQPIAPSALAPKPSK